MRPSASATTRWWRSMCERMKAPARSSPMTSAASSAQPGASATRGSRTSIMAPSRVDPWASREARSVPRDPDEASVSPADGGSVRPRPDLLVQGLQLVGGEVLGLAEGDDLLLVGLDFGDGLGDLRDDL